MIRLCLALVFVVAAAVPAGAEPASPEERAAAIARPAVVFVQVRWHGWVRDPRTGEVFGGPAGYEATTTCSGVVVAEDGYVATAAHCVDPGPAGGGGALVDLALADLTKLGRVGEPGAARSQLEAHAVVEGADPGSPVLREVRVERVVGTSARPERDVAPATVVDLLPADDGDVGVLKIPRDRLPAAAVADEDGLPAGTPILAIGYPAAAERATDPTTEPTNKNGQISTRRTVGGSPYYEVSAAASPGMSGGPVVDMSGRVVGLVSAAPAGETQSFNLVTASASIMKVLRGKDVRAAPSANDRNFVAGLDRYYAGDYPAAVEFFDAVLAATPAHRQAAEYRRLAAEHGAGGPSLLLLLIVGCAAVAVVTGVAGMVLLTNRRRAAKAGADLPTPPFGFQSPVVGQPALAGGTSVAGPAVASPPHGTQAGTTTPGPAAPVSGTTPDQPASPGHTDPPPGQAGLDQATTADHTAPAHEPPPADRPTTPDHTAPAHEPPPPDRPTTRNRTEPPPDQGIPDQPTAPGRVISIPEQAGPGEGSVTTGHTEPPTAPPPRKGESDD